MNQIALIQKYFPELSATQLYQFEMLLPLYTEWNAKINLISRKDFEHFYERHVLHSLAIAKFIQFDNGIKVIDIGTGGGFPGIPLAIVFPYVNFILVDSITKKIKVVNEVAKKLGLINVETIIERAAELELKADFIISRATASLAELISWTKSLLRMEKAGTLNNGWITLKGGNLEDELKLFEKNVQIKLISSYFNEPFFETKKIVYLPYKKV